MCLSFCNLLHVYKLVVTVQLKCYSIFLSLKYDSYLCVNSKLSKFLNLIRKSLLL